MRKITRLFIVLMILQLAGCATRRSEQQAPQGPASTTAYERLLSLYPEDAQGLGKESFFPTVEHQPMTYGLILSAEAAHFKKTHGEEGRRRIRKAVRWVLDNRDLDRDGLPGWGLPQAWDAFSDGSTDPRNSPYTITTAIVLNGLLDALAIPGFWSRSERDEIRTVIAAVVVRWCSEIWSPGFSGGFFWYSPNPADAIFAVNSPSMFLGSMSRVLHEQLDALTEPQRALVQGRADDMARAIVHTVGLRQGAPFWDYRAIPRAGEPRRANDLIHHVYTLLGVETYRDCGGSVKLPWTRKQAVESVDRFWADGQIREFPQDVTYAGPQAAFNEQPAVLWSAGMMLTAYARWGERDRAARTFETISQAYGPIPDLRLHPRRSPQGDAFYPRQAAHVLWGLALYAFGDGSPGG